MLRVALVVALAALAVATSRPGRAGTSPGEAGPGAVAVAADLSLEGSHTRLAVTLSRPVAADSFLLSRPDRVVIELGDVNLQLPAEAGSRRVGVVAGFRVGTVAPGRSRIVLELAEPAIVTRLEVEGSSPATRQLVIELERVDRDAFRRAAASPPDPATTGSIRFPAIPDHRPLVAIDAGHGGTDPGAIAANGTPEKDIVLAFAKTLREELESSGRLRVVMIRDDDSFVPLDDRVRRARAAGADLFISIHGDFMSLSTTRGATIYTGAERATDSESARLAERENAADLAGGHAAHRPEPGVQDILHDLTVRETRGLSHRFAQVLLSDMAPVLRFNIQPHREAGFRVLRAHDIPSVLIELGYLSNSRDTDLLVSEPWRRRTGAAMAGAVERFFGARLGARAAVSP